MTGGETRHLLSWSNGQGEQEPLGWQVVSDAEATYEVREMDLGPDLLRVKSGLGRPSWEVVGPSGYVRGGGYAASVSEAQAAAEAAARSLR